MRVMRIILYPDHLSIIPRASEKSIHTAGRCPRSGRAGPPEITDVDDYRGLAGLIAEGVGAHASEPAAQAGEWNAIRRAVQRTRIATHTRIDHSHDSRPHSWQEAVPSCSKSQEFGREAGEPAVAATEQEGSGANCFAFCFASSSSSP